MFIKYNVERYNVFPRQLSLSLSRIYHDIYLWLLMDQSDPSKKDESVLRSKIRVSEKTVNNSNRKCVWHAVRLQSFSRIWPQRFHHRSKQSLVPIRCTNCITGVVIDASLLFIDCTSAKIVTYWKIYNMTWRCDAEKNFIRSINLLAQKCMHI